MVEIGSLFTDRMIASELANSRNTDHYLMIASRSRNALKYIGHNDLDGQIAVGGKPITSKGLSFASNGEETKRVEIS